jgi:hypothetical protein
LYLAVRPNPDVGQAPLTSAVALSVSGTATGQIHYWLDCTGDGSWEDDFLSDSPTEVLFCVYPNAGNYTVLAQIQRGGQGPVAVNAPVIVTP